MAFTKTSVAVDTRVIGEVEAKKLVAVASTGPCLGDEKDGLVWDGEMWVSKAEWESHKVSHLPTGD